MAYTEYTLWLIPSEPMRSSLRSTIIQLAAKLDAVAFEPHVTLFCGPSDDGEVLTVARRIGKQFPPIELIANHLDHSDAYTKTLFIQFQESALARQMFSLAAAGFSRPSDYILNPHLSLLYKNQTAETRQKLCETLDARFGSYSFDRIRMIETEIPIEDEGPIRRWRLVCEEPLLGS